jgi:hypothetical protein
VSAAEARATLATIEDGLDAAGWPWAGAVSRLVDALVIIVEKGDDGR